MSKIEVKHPDKAVVTGAYSAGILIDGWLFISGQGSVDLADINDFDQFNAAYLSFFNGILPARTTVQSVLSDGIKIEIDAIARINDQGL
jgi:2-iminobutanoate/2-iminopropanoate deaminase